MIEKDEKKDEQPEEGNKNFTLLYVAIGCFAAACVLFALAFVISGAGVYMLIASMICALAAVSFINGQKRKASNTLCKVMQILSYVVMIAALAVFIFGASVSGTAK
ncbi:MAG: hypothetical protein NC033_05460 [Clostridiales bacterium]|nr:hypothetical protein [Clostridiales bacterium]